MSELNNIEEKIYQDCRKDIINELKNQPNKKGCRSRYYEYQQKIIGNICRENRIKKGIRVSELANSLKCSWSVIYQFEKGIGDSYIVLLEYIRRGLYEVKK